MADEFFGGAIGLPEDEEPLTAGDSIFPSLYGEEMVGESDGEVTTDPDGGTATATIDVDLLATGLASSAQERARLAGGLFNADFKIGPPKPSEAIDENNPLPYWKVGSVQAGAVFLKWNGWAGGSGYLTAEGYDCSEGDDIYLEQIVPVSGYGTNKVVLPMCLFGTDVTAAGGTYDLYGWVEAETYDSAGASLGAAEITLQGGGGSLHNPPGEDEAAFVIVPLSNTAKWMRVRILVSAMSPAAGYQRQYIIGSSAAPPSLISITNNGADEAVNGTGTSSLYLTAHTTGATSLGGGATQWVSPGYGWVSAISLRTMADRSAGKAIVGVYSTTDSNYVGPSLKINATVTGNTDPLLQTRGQYNKSGATNNPSTHHGNMPSPYNYIDPGNKHYVRFEVFSGTYNQAGSNGVVVTFTAQIIDELYPSEYN